MILSSVFSLFFGFSWIFRLFWLFCLVDLHSFGFWILVMLDIEGAFLFIFWGDFGILAFWIWNLRGFCFSFCFFIWAFPNGRAIRSDRLWRSILLSLTQGVMRLKTLRRFLLFISFIYPLLFEVFPSANVLNLANFTSPNAVLIGYVAGKPNTKLADSQYRASFHFARLFSFIDFLRVKKALS